MLATALYEPPADFNTRTGFDLKRIVEDQVSKDFLSGLSSLNYTKTKVSDSDKS